MKSINWKKDYVYMGICILLIALSYLIISLLFCFEDVVSFTVWSVDFWDCLFQGDFSNYYDYCSHAGRFWDVSPQGSWLTFFPWIIWNLPLWLTHPKSTNPNVTGLGCILWSKLLLLICLISLCILVYRIIKLVREDDNSVAWLASLLTAGSLEMLVSVGYAGQDEIIYMTVFIAAIYCILSGRDILYLIFATITVTICPIMIIFFFVCEFIYRKKTGMLFLRLLLFVSPTVLFEVFYRNNELYHSLSSFNTAGIFQLVMTRDVIGTTLGETSVVMTLLVVLGLYCLFSKKEGKEKIHQLIWCTAFAGVCISFMTYSSWYRFCVYIPMIAILVAVSDHYNVNIFILSVVGFLRNLDLFIEYNGINYNNQYLSLLGKTVFKHYPPREIASLGPLAGIILLVIRPVTLGGIVAILVFTLLKKNIIVDPGDKLGRRTVFFNSILCFLWALFILFLESDLSGVLRNIF